jgi:ribosome biogenesis SPOUT family RNA methylase Rps3
MKYIIEHLEKEVYDWCLIEYEHISKIVGKGNLIFTNVKSKEDKKKLVKWGEVYNESIHFLINNLFAGKRLCLLDSDAKKTLCPYDADKFDFLIFGGILGDYPPKARTKELLGDLECEKRNLLKEQMSTDNAVYTTKKIISGVRINKMKFKDGTEIKINKIESTILPYRYAIVNGKPLISEKLMRYLKRRNLKSI